MQYLTHVRVQELAIAEPVSDETAAGAAVDEAAASDTESEDGHVLSEEDASALTLFLNAALSVRMRTGY